MKVTDFAFPLGHTLNSSVPGDPQPISIGFLAEDIQPLETDPDAVCWRDSDPRERFLKAPLGALYGRLEGAGQPRRREQSHCLSGG